MTNMICPRRHECNSLSLCSHAKFHHTNGHCTHHCFSVSTDYDYFHARYINEFSCEESAIKEAYKVLTESV